MLLSDLNFPDVNLDLEAVRPVALAPLGVDDAHAPVSDDEKERQRREWLDEFARSLYGPIPDVDARVTCERIPSATTPGFEHLAVRVEVDGRTFQVDAGMWLPPGEHEPGSVPMIVALDLTGPAGVLNSTEYPLDPDSGVLIPDWLSGTMLVHGPINDVMRGTASYRWPVDLILERGWGLIISCYGSWAPDDADHWRSRGVGHLLGLEDDPKGPRQISLWAWSLSRLIDAACSIAEIDAANLATIGWSRLGKTALWAAANDERIQYVISHESGCGGASIAAHNYGETLSAMRQLFPQWVLPADQVAEDAAGIDQHQLLASVWPRHLYVASGEIDNWADPRGEYLGFKLASSMWDAEGAQALPDEAEAVSAPSQIRLGKLQYHSRPGGHEMTAYDWRQYMEYLERCRTADER